ncbi:MAG: sulfatase-like hydrolase/transferase, partial [Elusimicrobiota bacterium]|nr:sulfatase-like hydrolase/transferase [Elusimicrobiota bacterium]
MTKFYIPSRFLAFLAFAFFNAFIFTVLRIIFYFVNAPEQIVSAKLVLRAFLVGARFDLRIAFLFALPLGILFLLPYKKRRKKIFSIIYALAFAVVTVIYFIDFGYYAYLKERLNAYIIELASNTLTSLEMVWQTYPVLKGFFALCIIAALYYFFVSKLFVWAYSRTSPKKHYWYALPALLIAAAFVHGRVSQYPLRWSNAYFSSDNFVSSLALNPVQNLFDTYTFAKKGSGFNKEETRKYYDIVADYLGVTDKDKERLNFVRNIPPARGGVKNYNVVIILTESLSYDKTSFAIGEIDTTPNAFALAKRGVLFENFFTPTTGTARGVFTSVTGLPDTSAAKTSSRNPTIVNQHSLINDLKGYNKFYFIGGSTNWGNVRGLLQHTIEGLKIFEEGTYEGQNRTDVWGISDLDMFR